MRGYKLSRVTIPLTPTLSPSKSDISDFDQLKCRTRASPSSVGAREASARHRPYSRCWPRAGPLTHSSRRSRIRTEGARDAVGPGALRFTQGGANQKCSDPRASTPRDIEACRSPVPALFTKAGKPQVRRSLGVPRTVFCRFAPHRPRWTDLSGFRHCQRTAYPPLLAQVIAALL